MSAPTRLEVLSGELDALRSEIATLEALEPVAEPGDDAADAVRSAFDTYSTSMDRLGVALDEWDTKKADHDAVAVRSQRLDAVRSASLAPAGRQPIEAPNVAIRREALFDDLDGLRFNPDDAKAPRMTQGVVSRAVTALEETRPYGISDDEMQAAVSMVERTPGAAQHALIHGSPAYRSAFEEWGKTQGQPVYTPEQADAVRTAMSLTGANGGYTLPTLLDPTLIHTGTASRDEFRSISRVVSGTQNVWHGASASNVTAYWAAEAAALTEGSPTLSNPSVTAAALTAWLTGSYEIFEDSDLQGQLPGLIGEAFSYMEQDAFAVGSGSTAPKGILTAISGTAGDVITCGTRGTFAYTDLTNLHDAVPTRYENTSTWVANKVQFTAVRNFSTGSYGSLFWSNLTGGTPPLLIDSPYMKASALSTATTSGTFFMIYGDFSQFLIYDRIGTQVEFVQNVFNSSGLPTRQRGLIAHKRVGSDVTDVNAFRLLKG